MGRTSRKGGRASQRSKRVAPFHRALARASCIDGDWEWCAEQTARAVVTGVVVGEMIGATRWPKRTWRWLVESADPLAASVLEECARWLAGVEPAELFAGNPLFVERDAKTFRRSMSALLHDDDRGLVCAAAQQTLSSDFSRNGDKPTHRSPPDEAIFWFESYLAALDSAERSLRGVYFTPLPAVRFTVRQVDRMLRDELEWRDGLATLADSPSGFRLLDPAAGSGVFLQATIELVAGGELPARSTDEQLRQTIHQEQMPIGPRFANNKLLREFAARMTGFELLLPAAVAAHLNLAATLLSFGVAPRARQRDRTTRSTFGLHVLNAIGDHDPDDADQFGDERLADGYRAAVKSQRDTQYAVVIGNPPFSGVSRTPSGWAEDLLRGRVPAGDAEPANYFMIDGQPLGERKHWLHDDYIKFLRYAHWQVERSGAGVVGLVTNHGYLDNLSMRGLRQSLLKTFSRIEVLDLQGNRIKSGTARSDESSRDEGIFAIDQGTAIAVFGRKQNASNLLGAANSREGSPADDAAAASDSFVESRYDARLEFGELRGSRGAKIAKLSRARRSLVNRRLSPVEPFYFFRPHDGDRADEFARGMSLVDVMPVHSTAAVTARDKFLIGFDADEVLSRLHALRDPAISDDEIRATYFQNGRSPKYPPGDTRGWKLAEARRRLREVDNPASLLREIQYRPFDRRVIAWADWLVDWPRSESMRHMLGGKNLAIVARRQAPSARSGEYVFVADGLVIDGLIRCDNRGSESFFPLWLLDSIDPHAPPQANLSTSFLGPLCDMIGAGSLEFDGRGALDVFAFLYAQLHAEAYRQRFAAQLQNEFPRVFLPSSRKAFFSLAELGRELIDVHRMHTSLDEIPRWQGASRRVAHRFPGWTDGGGSDTSVGRIVVSEHAWLEPVAETVWRHHVGSWQVCRKWLADRRDRTLSEREAADYTRIVASQSRTLEWLAELNGVIDRLGGFDGAFRKF